MLSRVGFYRKASRTAVSNFDNSRELAAPAARRPIESNSHPWGEPNVRPDFDPGPPGYRERMWRTIRIRYLILGGR